jgi:hypothetical protein
VESQRLGVENTDILQKFNDSQTALSNEKQATSRLQAQVCMEFGWISFCKQSHQNIFSSTMSSWTKKLNWKK